MTVDLHTSPRERPILFQPELARAIADGRKSVTRRPVGDSLRVRLPRQVTSDPPFERDLVAKTGTYKASLNRQGAVSILVGERQLGVRPGEFHFECPYARGSTVLADHGATGGKRWMLAPVEGRLWVRETWYLRPRLLWRLRGDAEVRARTHRGGLPPGVGRARPLVPLLPRRWRGEGPVRAARRRRVPLAPRHSHAAVGLSANARRHIGRAAAPAVDHPEDEAAAEGMRFDGTYWDGGPHRIKGTPKAMRTARDAFADRWNAIYGAGAWEADPWVWAIRFRKEVARG